MIVPENATISRVSVYVCGDGIYEDEDEDEEPGRGGMMGPNIHFQLAGEAARVLNLLGIDNAALHRHIHCPLPEHEDSHPSFRVDEKRNRYFCTCNPKVAVLSIL